MQDQLLQRVYKEDRDQERYQDQIFVEQDGGETILVKQGYEEQRSDDLDYQMMPVDRGSAFAASAFDKDVAEDGDIEPDRNPVAAITAA